MLPEMLISLSRIECVMNLALLASHQTVLVPWVRPAEELREARATQSLRALITL